MNYFYVYIVYFIDNRPIKVYRTYRFARLYFLQHFKICLYIQKVRVYAER